MTTRVTAAGSETAAETRFFALARQWREATSYYSMWWQISDHDAYRKILAMGEAAVPWILRDLAETGYHWFDALQQLTGEDAAKDVQRGRRDLAQEAWLAWGRERGMIE